MFEMNDISKTKRIFCNRSLNMAEIEVVGFDMDYTLALYHPETFEVLAYQESLKKLVEKGYPEIILKWEFDFKYMIRGLSIDKQTGNVVKMDRHRYVKVAVHGFREISRSERRSLYDAHHQATLSESRFLSLDTMFAFAEAYLFCQLVELKDSGCYIQKTYEQIYYDIRSAIDLCHRDGSIKDCVAQEPEKYIQKNDKIVSLMHLLKKSGKKLFVLTNSLWDYTNVVMTYMAGEGWVDLFDVVITGANKPGFFTNSNELFEVTDESGLLKNVVKGIYGGKVFQGGNFKHLNDMLNIQSGSSVLYVGDHIYGDIVKSKKDIGWRTMLVIPELETEIEVLNTSRDLLLKIDNLLYTREQFEDKKAYFLQLEAENEEYREELLQLSQTIDATKTRARDSVRKFHMSFHHVWGQLFKTGRQNSRFAQQVQAFACLYTSRVTNLLYYPPTKRYQAMKDDLPHDI